MYEGCSRSGQTKAHNETITQSCFCRCHMLCQNLAIDAGPQRTRLHGDSVHVSSLDPMFLVCFAADGSLQVDAMVLRWVGDEADGV